MEACQLVVLACLPTRLTDYMPNKEAFTTIPYPLKEVA